MVTNRGLTSRPAVTRRALPMRRMWRRTGALVATLVCLVMSMTVPSAGAAPTARPVRPAAVPAPQCASSGGSGMTCTQTATDGPSGTSYTMQVSVSQTQNLQPRQTVTLNWSGFAPTSNYSFFPGSGPRLYEYPVDILQCWGSDDAQQLSPTHCFAYNLPSVRNSIYADTNDPNNPNPAGKAAGNNTFLGFDSVSGTHYTMAGLLNQPPDLQSNPTFPGNSRYEWTGPDMTRNNVNFEVRDAIQYPSLGCSSTQVCTIVVVPILHPGFCADGADPNCTGP
ncbi:MAG TPA: hypothetical protein VH352_14220, partial [Pseudonocardiaceae bacterium]|nr:hypothetical protein [Pseudonocardiaceae bacterium]